jgi:hypothetical protein
VQVIATFKPSQGYAYAYAGGALTLRTRLGLQFTQNWMTSGEDTRVKVSPGCFWPLCWSVNIFGLAGFAVGAKVGLSSVTSFVTYTTASFAIETQTTVSAKVEVEYSSSGASFFEFNSALSNSYTVTAPPSMQSSIDAMLGLQPKLQVGIWGIASVFAAGGSVAISGEGVFLAYVAFHGEASSLNYVTSAPTAYSGRSGCSQSHDTRLLLSMGAKYRSLNFVASADVWAGCVFSYCAWRWHPTYSHSWTYGDTAPYVIWGLCLDLALNPAPAPPLPPGAALCAAFTSSGSTALERNAGGGSATIYSYCNIILTHPA